MVPVVAVHHVHVLQSEVSMRSGPVLSHLIAAGRGKLSVIGLGIKAAALLRAVLGQQVAAHQCCHE